MTIADSILDRLLHKAHQLALRGEITRRQRMAMGRYAAPGGQARLTEANVRTMRSAHARIDVRGGDGVASRYAVEAGVFHWGRLVDFRVARHVLWVEHSSVFVGSRHNSSYRYLSLPSHPLTAELHPHSRIMPIHPLPISGWFKTFRRPGFQLAPLGAPSGVRCLARLTGR